MQVRPSAAVPPPRHIRMCAQTFADWPLWEHTSDEVEVEVLCKTDYLQNIKVAPSARRVNARASSLLRGRCGKVISYHFCVHTRGKKRKEKIVMCIAALLMFHALQSSAGLLWSHLNAHTPICCNYSLWTVAIWQLQHHWLVICSQRSHYKNAIIVLILFSLPLSPSTLLYTIRSLAPLIIGWFLSSSHWVGC